MPTLNKDRGSHAFDLLKIPISFAIASDAATNLRDGTKVASSEKTFSVSRTSTGLYKVSFAADGAVRPQLPIAVLCDLEQAAAPTTACRARYVKDSWAYSSGVYSFSVQICTEATGAASEPDSGDRVSILILGSTSSAGTDPA